MGQKVKPEIDFDAEIKKYNFKNKVKIHFHQIDAIGVLYNIQYLYLFENARLDYLQNLGLILTLNDLITQFPVMTVSHHIDYINSAEFGDDVEIYTRVKSISNSSLIFENIAVKNTNVLLAKSSTVYVYIDALTKKSKPIPEEIKYLFLSFEKGNIETNIKN
jgi:acyl-CoA thioester hydrolase